MLALFPSFCTKLALDNRQVNYARFAQSDEKIDGASAALSLCGIALKLKNGTVKTTGTDIDKILPDVSRFCGGNV